MLMLKLLFCVALLKVASCKKSKFHTTDGSIISITTSTTPNSWFTNEAEVDNATDIPSLETSDEPVSPTKNSMTPAAASETTCQIGTSMVMERDIRGMIKYYLEQSNYQEILKEGHKKFKKVLNETEDELEEFVQWFKENPEHLKHVLEEVAQSRHDAEDILQDVAYQLDYLPYLQSSHEDIRKEFAKVTDKYNKAQKICQWNCENDWQRRGRGNQNEYDNDRGFDIQDRGSKNDHDFANEYGLQLRSQPIESDQSYYCTTLKDLNNKVNDRVSHFKSSIGKKIDAELALTTERLIKNMESFKGELRDVALKNFGRIMYDILALQDEQVHLDQRIITVDLVAVVSEIQEAKLGVEQKLLELRRLVDTYGRKCSGCSNYRLKKLLSLSGANYNILADNSQENSDMVDILFDDIAKEIEDQFTQEMKQAVKNLNGRMDTDSELFNEFTEAHRAIQEQIKHMTTAESQHLEDLSAPLESLHNFIDLRRNYKSLYDHIEKYIFALK